MVHLQRNISTRSVCPPVLTGEFLVNSEVNSIIERSSAAGADAVEGFELAVGIEACGPVGVIKIGLAGAGKIVRIDPLLGLGVAILQRAGHLVLRIVVLEVLHVAQPGEQLAGVAVRDRHDGNPGQLHPVRREPRRIRRHTRVRFPVRMELRVLAPSESEPIDDRTGLAQDLDIVVGVGGGHVVKEAHSEAVHGSFPGAVAGLQQEFTGRPQPVGAVVAEDIQCPSGVDVTPPSGALVFRTGPAFMGTLQPVALATLV